MAAVFTALAASVALSLAFAARGVRSRSLSGRGAAAAVFVGTLHMFSGFEFGATLILFYVTSSKLTKWRSELKSKLEADHAVGGQRGAAQVMANSLVGGALAAATAWLRSTGSSASASMAGLTSAAFLGFYACCCADTWSSEVGVASTHPPRLLTTGRLVPPGTNGAVSLLGTAAAAAGGLLMGCCYQAAAALACSVRGPLHASCASVDWRLVPLAVLAGVAGSLLDSLLGATLQYSAYDQHSGKVVSGRPAPSSAAAAAAGAADSIAPLKHISGRDVLSNTGVNVVASCLSSLLAAAMATRMLLPH